MQTRIEDVAIARSRAPLMTLATQTLCSATCSCTTKFVFFLTVRDCILQHGPYILNIYPQNLKLLILIINKIKLTHHPSIQPISEHWTTEEQWLIQFNSLLILYDQYELKVPLAGHWRLICVSLHCPSFWIGLLCRCFDFILIWLRKCRH